MIDPRMVKLLATEGASPSATEAVADVAAARAYADYKLIEADRICRAEARAGRYLFELPVADAESFKHDGKPIDLATRVAGIIELIHRLSNTYGFKVTVVPGATPFVRARFDKGDAP